jgi:hypothetical protein
MGEEAFDVSGVRHSATDEASAARLAGTIIIRGSSLRAGLFLPAS